MKKVFGLLAVSLLLLSALLLPLGVQAQSIDWKCKDYRDVRSDNVGRVLWAYCFGIGGDQVYVKKRVILPEGFAIQSEIDAAFDDLKSWVLTGSPDLFARTPSQAIWNDPRVAEARAAMDRAIAAEKSAGTIPKPKPWRVAPNPSSTTVPPTRPMWDAAGLKQVTERAYVDDICNCASPVIKGTQTLCPLRQLGDLPPTTNITACVRN